VPDAEEIAPRMTGWAIPRVWALSKGLRDDARGQLVLGQVGSAKGSFAGPACETIFKLEPNGDEWPKR